MESITVNGTQYFKNVNHEFTGDYKIVVLQRGWVLVGKFERTGTDCKLHNASVIRNWGTSKGLGELVNGPTPSTKLDKCNGLVEFDSLTMVLSVAVSEEKWKNAL